MNIPEYAGDLLDNAGEQEAFLRYELAANPLSTEQNPVFDVVIRHNQREPFVFRLAPQLAPLPIGFAQVIARDCAQQLKDLFDWLFMGGEEQGPDDGGRETLPPAPPVDPRFGAQQSAPRDELNGAHCYACNTSAS